MTSVLRRHGTTIALVVMAAIAGAYVLVADRGSVTTTERVTRKRNVLTSFHDDDVREVKVTSFGQAARIFRGAVDDAGQRPWKVEVDGATWPAEESVVDQYLASLRDGVVDRWLTGSAENTGDMRATVAVQMESRRWLVTLRGPAPTPKGAIYIEVQGDGDTRTGVITAQLAAVLLAEPASFRQKALVPVTAADVTAITLDGEAGPRRLVKAPSAAPRGGTFRFDGSGPEGPVRVSSHALDRIWDAIGKLQAEAFLADAEADKALDRKVALAIGTTSSGRITVDLGGACPGHPDDIVAIRRDDRGARVSACVPRASLEGLNQPAADLVDRKLVGARIEEVIDLKLASGPTTIALARSGTGWHQQSPVDRNLDADLGKAFLERLLAVSAPRFIAGDPKALGLDPPRSTVRVVSLASGATQDGGDAERTELLEVGADRGGIVVVRRVEDGALAELPAAAAEVLIADETALRARRIYTEPFARFRELRITSPGHPQRLTRSADGTWIFAEPKGFVPDPSLTADLAEVLGNLLAERWVGPARPEHGLDRPRLSIEADLEASDGGPARTLKVMLGAPSGSSAGSFARAGDDPAVFVAMRRLEEAADRWLVDRNALVTDVSRARRVTIEAPGAKKVVLERSGGALHIAGAASDPVANATAAAVREALSDLVAEGATSVGKADKNEGLDKPSLEVTAELDDNKVVRIRFGSVDVWRGISVVHARREGVEATFAVAQSRVRPLFEAVGK